VTAGSVVPGAHAPGTGALLLDGAPEQQVSRRSLDVQDRFGPVQSGQALTPAVVVCTRAADPDADELSLRLAARSIPMLRIDADRDHDDDLAWDGEQLTLTRAGRTYLPRVLWTRLYTPAARPGDQHAREQTAARAANLAALPGALTINPGARLADAPNRLAQLAFAAARGFRTPRSEITHAPRDATDVVVKAVGPHFLEPEPGRALTLIPRRMTIASLPPQGAPLLVQEPIAHVRELRVFVVGERCIAYALRKPSLDAAAHAPETIAVEPARLPEHVAARVRALVADLALQIAAVDLLDTGSGLVFLEVNASGSWRWFEHRTKTTDVSAAVAAWVAERFAEVAA
jgi:ribosomal protein S6-L-glutamate ligase RimK-like protein